MKVICLTAIMFAIIACMQPVSAYTFQEQSYGPDSVRLSLNTNKSVNGTIAIDVIAYEVTNIYSATFDLNFNASVLEWMGSFTHDPDGYESGNFFDTSAIYAIGNEIDANGTASSNKLIAGVIGNPSVPKSGDGVVMTIKFKIVGKGTTQVSFFNSNLIRPDMSFTSSAWYGGTLISDETVPVLTQDNPPLVSMNVPDQFVFSSRNVMLLCRASDDYGLASVTLFTTITGSWQPYRTAIAGETVWTEGFYLTNLDEGTYKWNCMATDSKGQEAYGQADYFFTVQLPASSIPPQRSNGQPAGNINETNVTLSLETDKMAECRHANVHGLGFDSMLKNFTVTGGTFHSESVNLSTGYLYNYYVKCRDSDGATNPDDYLISFYTGTVAQDTQPPVIANDMITGLIPAGLQYATLSVRTDENAFCKFAGEGGMIFESMKKFANTYFLNHSELVSGLREGVQYDHYVKCSDAWGNTNPSDTMISFYVCYEIDEDCNRNVNMSEMIAFIDRWEIDSKYVNIKRLMQGLSLWKSGVA